MSAHAEAAALVRDASEMQAERFQQFLEHISDDTADLQGLAERITPQSPLIYWSMEFYDKEDNDIKGGGGLGVLAADIRRVAEELQIPLVVITPFYREESHQQLADFEQQEYLERPDPDRLFHWLGQTAISTLRHPVALLNVHERQLGSTRIMTVTENGFGELYAGANNDDHRLYQEVALGFGGYQALKESGLQPALMQLNEAPTVFAAIARLDDLCQEGIAVEQALGQVKQQLLYTNHTLVQAVEADFHTDQFEHMVMPNIKSEAVRDWLRGMFGDNGRLRLSSLAIELSGTKSAVSELHARVSDFRDRDGNQVKFEAVTNGISGKWTSPETLDYYRQIGVLDEFGLPAAEYHDRLANLDVATMRRLKALGRQEMNRVLSQRRDQYGHPVHIPEDALVFDFKRRIADYKRPGLAFDDPERLAEILESNNAHFVLSGKPHANDGPMKTELTRILRIIDGQPILKARVHYIQDYDEAVGRALAIGGDCAVNVPEVGKEACGTSWMKDMSNLKLLISTADGGVADSDPVACLEVRGQTSEQEKESLYRNMQEAVDIIRDDARYKDFVVYQLQEYLPVISGPRMMAHYLQLFNRLLAGNIKLEAAA